MEVYITLSRREAAAFEAPEPTKKERATISHAISVARGKARRWEKQIWLCLPNGRPVEIVDP